MPMKTAFRTIAFLLAALMMLALCACSRRGGDINKPGPTESDPPADIEVASDTTPEPALPHAEGHDRTGDQRPSDYADSLNMLRVYKNRFYNKVDGALGEDSSISFLLYGMMDFVYGDAMLDVFAYALGEQSRFEDAIEAKGFTGVRIAGRLGYAMYAEAYSGGEEYSFCARYDAEHDSASLCVYRGETLWQLFEWRLGKAGCVLQYAKAADTEGLYAGYRAFLTEDGSGSVSCGSFVIGVPESIYPAGEISRGFVGRNMFSYDTFSVEGETVTVRHNGREYVHEIGDVPPTEAPLETGEDEP